MDQPYTSDAAAGVQTGLRGQIVIRWFCDLLRRFGIGGLVRALENAQAPFVQASFGVRWVMVFLFLWINRCHTRKKNHIGR